MAKDKNIKSELFNPEEISNHPQESFEVQSQEVPVRVREWRGAEAKAV